MAVIIATARTAVTARAIRHAMTEQDWLASSDPAAMLDFCDGGEITRNVTGRPTYRVKPSDRKMRLFACAVARDFYAPPHPDRRAVIEVAESVADDPSPGWHKRLIDARKSIDAVYGWIWCATCPDIAAGLRQTVAQERKPPCASAILREIVGNPFQGTPIWAVHDRAGKMWPTFLTPTVLALARAAYEERPGDDGSLDPVPLAILADALEEAGCVDNTILSHLRVTGLHVRGCWVVDLVLGKA